jgi:hypothetical protein
MKVFNSPRMRWALLIALVSDALGFGVVLFPPLQWLLDAVTAIALLMVLGFRWPLMIALVIEVIPAIELFPAWTLVVLGMAASGRRDEGRGTRDGQVVNRKS